jgi:hypothetical protein
MVARLGHDVRALYPVGGPIGDLSRCLVDEEGVTSQTLALSPTQDTREASLSVRRKPAINTASCSPVPS